jgi:hypothetical protein
MGSRRAGSGSYPREKAIQISSVGGGAMYFWVSTCGPAIETATFANFVSSLIKSLKGNPNPQTQYWAICCLWQLSFEQPAAEGLDK